MARVKINIELDPDAPELVLNSPQVKAATTKEAKEIAARANSMGSGFRTEVVVDYETKETRGGTQPEYAALNARATKKGCIALVVEKNYAAMKDNHLNNTLLKAKG